MSSDKRAADDERNLLNEQMQDVAAAAADKEQHRLRQAEQQRRQAEKLERLYQQIAGRTPPQHHGWLHRFLTDPAMDEGAFDVEPASTFGGLERLRFLRALAKNEDDAAIRLAYADWLDEQGEHEEADRQRKWPAAHAWFLGLCKVNPHYEIAYEQLLEFGRHVNQKGRASVRLYAQDERQGTWEAIEDNQQEFWKHWTVLTGLPLPPGLETMTFDYWECCVNEAYYSFGPRDPHAEIEGE